jgi:endonuclease YncB( thermonuclease family)
MPYLLIQGSYRVLNASPDGDSVKFYPKDVSRWQDLMMLSREHRVQPNSTGGVQLRLEGIDALETHYQGLAQPLELAKGASSALLKFLGFKQVVRDDNEKVISARPEAVQGYILTRFADTYGRAVSFAFKGKPSLTDGAMVFLDVKTLKQSANYFMVEAGLAYPTYYKGLFYDLRQTMTGVITKARAKKLGIWKKDKTNKGFSVERLATITDDVIMLPKLFRRLAEYIEQNDGDNSLAGFERFLEAKNDRLMVLSTGQFTGFDNILDIQGQKVKLLYKPEDLVFFEK